MKDLKIYETAKSNRCLMFLKFVWESTCESADSSNLRTYLSKYLTFQPSMSFENSNVNDHTENNSDLGFASFIKKSYKNFNNGELVFKVSDLIIYYHLNKNFSAIK